MQDKEKINSMKDKVANLLDSQDCKQWFLDAYRQYLDNEKNKPLRLSSITPLGLGDCINASNLAKNQVSSLAKVAVIKLNGGLGTSMGCDGAKSLIHITQSDRFIDMIIKQKEFFQSKFNIDIPFYLMNSFNTHHDMLALGLNLNSFTQNKVPRIDIISKDIFTIDNQVSFVPPGHADVYRCLLESGISDQLLEQNIDVLFISNSDNLGATLDISILNYFIEKSLDFLMEVTPKTKLDVKGGSIIKNGNRLGLLERAQVHKDDLHLFEDIQTFSYFNTNNIWLNTRALKAQYNASSFCIPVIFNHKEIQNRQCVQFESAMGCGLSLFEKASCIEVARDRFFPVKKTSDLLLIRSNLIEKKENGELINMSTHELPKINLSKDYDRIDIFEKRFLCTPMFKNLKTLSVEGGFVFKENVVLSGTVKLINTTEKCIELKDKTFEDEVVRF